MRHGSIFLLVTSELVIPREWNLSRNRGFYDYSKAYSLGYIQSVIKLPMSGLARTQSDN